MGQGKFIFGLVLGISLGMLIAQNVGVSLEAKKPSQLDIIYNVSSQNFYQIQKLSALSRYQSDLLMLVLDKTKVKSESITPLTNRLQQEMFTLDLKIKELNQ